MAANYPSYATTYGENHGYNERAGSNNTAFRNRYTNPNYREPAARGGAMQEFAPAEGGYVYNPASQTATLPAISPTAAGAATSTSLAATQALAGRGASPTQAMQARAGSPKFDGSQSQNFSDHPKFSASRGAKAVPIFRPGLSEVMQANMNGTGKDSMCRRLPEKTRLQYHVPGYMGFVKNQQFLHGQTYGKTTRKCIVGL